jgi:hypothetical protein
MALSFLEIPLLNVKNRSFFSAHTVTLSRHVALNLLSVFCICILSMYQKDGYSFLNF